MTYRSRFNTGAFANAYANPRRFVPRRLKYYYDTSLCKDDENAHYIEFDHSYLSSAEVLDIAHDQLIVEFLQETKRFSFYRIKDILLMDKINALTQITHLHIFAIENEDFPIHLFSKMTSLQKIIFGEPFDTVNGENRINPELAPIYTSVFNTLQVSVESVSIFLKGFNQILGNLPPNTKTIIIESDIFNCPLDAFPSSVNCVWIKSPVFNQPIVGCFPNIKELTLHSDVYEHQLPILNDLERVDVKIPKYSVMLN